MHTTAASAGGPEAAATLSGAKIIPIAAEAAEAFLARLGEPAPDSVKRALGALEDDGGLIGVAALGAVSASYGSVTVAVAPARRRLHIGSDLLHWLVADAARTGIRGLLVSYPAGAAGADALIRSSGLLAARRVATGTVTAVLHCP